jgi:hypothetical protein
MKSWTMFVLAALMMIGLEAGTASATTVVLASGSGNGSSTSDSGSIDLTNPPFSGPTKVTFSFTDTAPANVSAFLCAGSTANCNAINGLSGVVTLNTLSTGFVSSALALGNYFFTLSFSSGSAGNFAWQFTADALATPIPAALLLFVTGLVGLGAFGYRRRGMSPTA